MWEIHKIKLLIGVLPPHCNWKIWGIHIVCHRSWERWDKIPGNSTVWANRVYFTVQCKIHVLQSWVQPFSIQVLNCAKTITTVVFYDLNQVALRFPEDKILSPSNRRRPTRLPSSIWVYKTHQLKWARDLGTALGLCSGDSAGPCLQRAPVCSRWPFRDDTVL